MKIETGTYKGLKLFYFIPTICLWFGRYPRLELYWLWLAFYIRIAKEDKV